MDTTLANPQTIPDPEPAAGYEDWAAWVKGGRTGARPAVPAKIPQAWWAKLGEELKADKHPHAPHPARGDSRYGAQGCGARRARRAEYLQGEIKRPEPICGAPVS